MRKLPLVLSLVLLATFQTALASELVIKGSTTVLPIAQKTAEEYMKTNGQLSISVSGGGSGEGIKAIIDGTCGIATSSREMKEAETKLAQEKGITVSVIEIAKDCVVPVVHPENPLKNITINQLKDIFTGKVSNWKELGGDDRPIVIVSRDTSSGTYEVWSEKVLNKEKVAPAAQLCASSGAVVQSVSKNKNAIGYIGIGYINKELTALTVNDIEATAETALSGQFPVSRGLYYMTRGTPEGEIKAYVDYVLGETGQEIVKEEGFVPITHGK